MDGANDGIVEKEEWSNSTHDYVFSVGDKVYQRQGVISAQVGGVILQNVQIDSGATCNLLEKGIWEWLKNCSVLGPQRG